MPTLLDQASQVLRNAVITARRKVRIRKGTSDDDLAKHFRHTATQSEFDGGSIWIPHVSFADIKTAPQKLTDWFIHSHHMDSCFNELLAFADAFYDGRINLMANVAYTLFYGSFLAIYSEMEPAQLPSRTYIAGIAIYTAGYICFALWAHSLAIDDAERASVAYNLGAWCFLIGSAALIYGLMPVMAGDARPLLKDLPRYPGIDGSVFFFVGSLVFASDAAGLNFFLGYDEIVGYSLFLLGRVFFVQASVTEWCGICFQRGHIDSEDSDLSAPLL